MASLVNFDKLCDYEEFRMREREHIILMLQTMQREDVTVYLLFSEDKPLPTKLKAVDEKLGMVLQHNDLLDTVHHINTSGIFVVADHANTQIQFHVDALAQDMSGAGSDYLLPIPDDLYLIQRRASRRYDIPDQDHVLCRIEGDEYPVLDLSEDGLALLDREGKLGIEASAHLAPAELSLPTGEVSLELAVANRFSIYLPDQNRKVCRIGCLAIDISDQARSRLDAYLATLVRRA